MLVQGVLAGAQGLEIILVELGVSFDSEYGREFRFSHDTYMAVVAMLRSVLKDNDIL